MRQVPIIHVHGLLGGFPHLTDNATRSYEPRIEPELIEVAASQIRIIHEADALGPEYDKAHKVITAANKICFLGFGYHPVNVERLRINELFRGSGLLGTAKGLGEAESSRAKDLFRALPRALYLPSLGQDVLTFLRNHDVL